MICGLGVGLIHSAPRKSEWFMGQRLLGGSGGLSRGSMKGSISSRFLSSALVPLLF